MARTISRASRVYTENPQQEKFETHLHGLYELYCFLSGDADYYIEGTLYSLSPGDILIIKKSEAHSVCIKSNRPYARIVVQFSENMLIGSLKKSLLQFLDERPLGKNNLFSLADHPDKQWQYYMEQIRTTTSRAKRELYITILVKELYDARYGKNDVTPARGLGVIPEMVNYISVNLTSPLRIEDLCSKFYISRAQLNRKFKAYTGTSVWEYITNKRLLLARDLLHTKDSPATACAKAGFNDYSTFYRAYKAKFGVSPKADQRQE